MIFTNGIFLFNPLSSDRNLEIEDLFKKISESEEDLKILYFGNSLYKITYHSQDFLVGRINRNVIFGPIVERRFHSFSLTNGMNEYYDKLNPVEKVIDRLLNI
jgi:hypothetical protein